jgi:hypothetical protein
MLDNVGYILQPQFPPDHLYSGSKMVENNGNVSGVTQLFNNGTHPRRFLMSIKYPAATYIVAKAD